MPASAANAGRRSLTTTRRFNVMCSASITSPIEPLPSRATARKFVPSSKAESDADGADAVVDSSMVASTESIEGTVWRPGKK